MRPQTPPTATISLTTNYDTPANVAQVEDLFPGIIRGEPQLDPVNFAKLKKFLKGATKAIDNAKIQQSTYAELLATKETEKRRNKRSKENYGFA
jgi:hypothetical protein